MLGLFSLENIYSFLEKLIKKFLEKYFLVEINFLPHFKQNLGFFSVIFKNLIKSLFFPYPDYIFLFPKPTWKI